MNTVFVFLNEMINIQNPYQKNQIIICMFRSVHISLNTYKKLFVNPLKQTTNYKFLI